MDKYQRFVITCIISNVPEEAIPSEVEWDYCGQPETWKLFLINDNIVEQQLNTIDNWDNAKQLTDNGDNLGKLLN